jgi:alkanesulfonate monooxygenase SsuD/methylene tetrahydromethanopterin reductase-like flavin-dependent oxidoreductase (luciferase family)
VISSKGYTALGFLAGRTENITLTLLVTGVTYRHPGVLAKTLTTLDVLSKGRAMLACGPKVVPNMGTRCRLPCARCCR